jgi:hypothetical protein
MWSSEMLVSYITTWRYNPEDQDLNLYHREKLKSGFVAPIFKTVFLEVLIKKRRTDVTNGHAQHNKFVIVNQKNATKRRGSKSNLQTTLMYESLSE